MELSSAVISFFLAIRTRGNSSNQNSIEDRSDSIVEQTLPFDDNGALRSLGRG